MPNTPGLLNGMVLSPSGKMRDDQGGESEASQGCSSTLLTLCLDLESGQLGGDAITQGANALNGSDARPIRKDVLSMELSPGYEATLAAHLQALRSLLLAVAYARRRAQPI